jgi:hypothetical protein
MTKIKQTIEITAKCSCGHEFKLESSQFEISSSECDCCGVTHGLELWCPGCGETLVLRDNKY